MKSIYRKIMLSLLVMLVLTGCQKDFLDRPSQSQISTGNFYQTKEEIRLATAALYGGTIWAEWNYSAYLQLGDVLSGNLVVPWGGGDTVALNTFTLSGSNGILNVCWKSWYKIIAHCNATINAIEQQTPATVDEADKNGGIAEAKFIRAMAYYNLALLWGEVPIIEDSALLATNNPLVNKNKVEDVYRFVTEDLIFAAENLPLTDETGRVTSWSAKGLLSKVYLTMAGLGQSGGTRNQQYLDLAKNTAEDVIKNSGLTLFPSYKDLFRTQFNDNPESLFALQWGVTSDWLTGNMLLLSSPSDEVTPGNAYPWAAKNVSYDLYSAYTEQDSIRRKVTFMLPGDYYAELNEAGGGYTANSVYMKKHVIGNEVDNNTPAMDILGSIEHNALLRLADVYLIYAEAILGNNPSTTDADALQYFNEVRQRAIPDASLVTSLDEDIILNERRLELACEGQYWYDLVRLSYYDPAKAVSLLNNQQRVTFQYDSATEVATPDAPASINPATFETFTLPLPSVEITANPKLADPAVPYYQ